MTPDDLLTTLDDLLATPEDLAAPAPDPWGTSVRSSTPRAQDAVLAAPDADAAVPAPPTTLTGLVPEQHRRPGSAQSQHAQLDQSGPDSSGHGSSGGDLDGGPQDRHDQNNHDQDGAVQECATPDGDTESHAQEDTDDEPGATRRRRWPRFVGAGLLVLAVPTGVAGVSLGRALTAPGTDSTSARLAEWARGHGMSGLVDRAERVTYRPPVTGGAPAQDSPLERIPKPAAAPRSTVLVAPLPPVVPPAVPALAGEGVWRTVVSLSGRPALREAFVRPDATHTSYTAGMAWMDPSLLRFALHPGTEEPGHGPWALPPSLTGDGRSGLVAAFNGGFRLDAARGGFFSDGRAVGELRTGAASFVVTSDGRAQVGQWGRDVSAGPQVVAVRQNLDLLVDGGQVVPGIADNAGHRWGATLGNALYVWRSGVGQTADGDLVYVSGNGLSAATLADLLVRAGAVRAMELDINPEWTSFVTYAGPDGTPVRGANLLPDMQRSPARYDSTSSRDFVAVLQR